jgi:quercetin dioxygenase-like cupin family protein
MPIILNQDSVEAKPAGSSVQVKILIDQSITSNDNVRLARWDIEPGGSVDVTVASGDIVWLQVLYGKISVSGSEGSHELTDIHLCFLPPDFKGVIQSDGEAAVLYARVPDATRFDPDFADHRPEFRVVDWTEEPVLDAEHDARKRIYMVTPQMFGTKAISGEMVIYPPGTEASNHFHEGAEHFQYLTKGVGTCFSNEEPHKIREGDMVYNYERERHYFRNDGKDDMVFVEFFVPGEYDTIWVDDAPVCAWLPTGRNIKGGAPSRHIEAHSSKPKETPTDV